MRSDQRAGMQLLPSPGPVCGRWGRRAFVSAARVPASGAPLSMLGWNAPCRGPWELSKT